MHIKTAVGTQELRGKSTWRSGDIDTTVKKWGSAEHKREETCELTKQLEHGIY